MHEFEYHFARHFKLATQYTNFSLFYQQHDRTSDLVSKLDIVKSENASMQEELITLREKQNEDQAKKLQDLEVKVKDRTQENENLTNRLQVLQTKTDELSADSAKLQQENAELQENANQANEVRNYNSINVILTFLA